MRMEAAFAAHLPSLSRRLLWCGCAVLGLGILLAPALWNGFPLLQYDTGGYLARWFEGYLVPSRPAAYGLLLAAAAQLQFWPVLLLQAACAIWIIYILLRELGLGGPPLVLLGVIAAMSLTTTLAFLTSILLTDIFAGLAVVALHLLVFSSQRLARWERVGIALLAAFGVAIHSATLGLIAALTALALIAAWWRGDIVPRAGARRAVQALTLGIVMSLSANWIVSGRFAFPPGGYGILFGRMLQDGIVSRYLDDHCPDPKLKLCPFRHELPRDADAFLWGESAFNRLGRFAGLGDEMQTIVLGSLREYPRLQIETALTATLAQLQKVGTGEGVVNRIWHTYGIMQRYTPTVVPGMREARQQRGGLSFETVNRIQVPIAFFSMAMLPIILVIGLRVQAFGDVSLLAATVGVAFLSNAFICGALSNPHHRYGARLVWLAPLVVILAVAPLLGDIRDLISATARFKGLTANEPGA
jgi:hypothetical protein